MFSLRNEKLKSPLSPRSRTPRYKVRTGLRQVGLEPTADLFQTLIHKAIRLMFGGDAWTNPDAKEI